MRLSRLPIPHVLLMLMTVGILGCEKGPSGPKATYVFVVDYSQSTADIRRQQLGAMLAELESAPEGSPVVVYRMGSKTEEIFSGQLGDEGVDEIVGTLKRTTIASDAVKGTNFAKMAEAVAQFTAASSSKRLLIRVLTDGADDYAQDPASVRTYRAAAWRISADKHLSSLVFFGVKPGYREGIRQAFGKAGAKLQILSPDQTIND